MGPPGKLVKRWDTQINPAVLGDLAFLSWDDDKHPQTSCSGTEGEKGRCTGSGKGTRVLTGTGGAEDRTIFSEYLGWRAAGARWPTSY